MKLEIRVLVVMVMVVVWCLLLGSTEGKQLEEENHYAHYRSLKDATSQIRSVLAAPSTPSGLISMCVNLVRHIPRVNQNLGPAPSYLDITPDNFSFSDVQPYGEGLAIPIGVPLILSIGVFFSWFFFCIIRCTCDSCGHRQPTVKYYTKKQINQCRVLIPIYFAVMGACFALGIASNSGLTSTEDVMFKSINPFLSRMISLRDDVLTMKGHVSDMELVGKSLNSTLNVLPDSNRIQYYLDCVATIFSLLDTQSNITTLISTLNDAVKSSVNFQDFATTLDNLDKSLKSLPDLTVLERKLKDFNQSLGGLPDIASSRSDLAKMNNSIALYRNVPNITSNLLELKNITKSFNGAVLRSEIVSFESGIATLPDLKLLHNNISNYDASKFDYIYGALLQLNDSIYKLPNMDNIISDIRQLNTSVERLKKQLVLSDAISTLQTAIHSLPDIKRLNQSISNTQAFVSSTNLDIIIVSVDQANRSLALLPSLHTVFVQVRNISLTIDKIQAVNISGLVVQLTVFNNTLDSITCILSLFDTLDDINKTLVVLPSDISNIINNLRGKITDQTSRLASIHNDISIGISSLKDLRTTMDNLPNFHNMTSDVQRINDTIGDLPNLGNVHKELVDLNSSMHSLPDLSTYIRQLTQVNQSLSNLPNLDKLQNDLSAFNKTIKTLPDLNTYVTKLQDVKNSTESIKPILDFTITSMQQAKSQGRSNSPTLFDEIPLIGVKNALLDSITALDNAVTSRPNATTLINSIDEFNKTIANLPDLDQTISSTNSLATSVNSFPNIDTLDSQLKQLETSRSNQNDVDSIIQNNQLSAVNSSIRSLPDLQNARDQSLTVDKNIKDANLDSTINQLKDLSNQFTSNDRNTIMSRLKDIQNFRDQIPNYDNITSQIDSKKKDLDVIATNITDARNWLNERRNRYQALSDRVDSVRVLFTTFLFFIPVLLSLTGIFGCAFKKPCPLMWMSITLFPVISIFFLFAAALMIPSTLLIDNCPQRDTLALRVLGKQVIHSSNVDFLGLSTDVSYATLYSYITSEDCSIPRPEILTNLDNAEAILQRLDLNLTEKEQLIFDKTKSYNLTLRENVTNLLDNMIKIKDRAIVTYKSAVELFFCNSTIQVIQPIINGFCDSLPGSSSVMAFIYFIYGLLALPGLFIGVKAYKRFNPLYMEGEHNNGDEDDDENDEDVKAMGGLKKNSNAEKKDDRKSDRQSKSSRADNSGRGNAASRSNQAQRDGSKAGKKTGNAILDDPRNYVHENNELLNDPRNYADVNVLLKDPDMLRASSQPSNNQSKSRTSNAVASASGAGRPSSASRTASRPVQPSLVVETPVPNRPSISDSKPHMEMVNTTIKPLVFDENANLIF